MKYTLFAFACLVVLLTGCSTKQQTENSESANGSGEAVDLPLQEKASTSYMFTSDDPDLYSVNLPLTGHSLRVGDEIDAINAANARVRFSIRKIMVGSEEIKELKTGETGYVDVKRLEGNVSDLNGDFYFVDKGAAFPKISTDNSTSSAPSSKGSVSLTVNNKAWTGDVVYQGALYYKGGIKLMDPSGKPYLQLAFKSNKSPDDRQFTFAVRNVPGNVGQVPTEGMEVLLSGSETGDTRKPDMVGYKNDSYYSGYSVQLVITKWEDTSANGAKMSATFTAKLRGVMGSADAVVTEGKLENIEVTVYTDKY
ncbi:MAG: hypothetical protein ACKOE6_07365 [Flammeovirgaceae bacterium]